MFYSKEQSSKIKVTLESELIYSIVKTFHDALKNPSCRGKLWIFETALKNWLVLRLLIKNSVIISKFI